MNKLYYPKPLNLPFSEACERNKGSILLILQKVLKGVLSVLEIGSGTGQHAVFIRKRSPHQGRSASVISVLLKKGRVQGGS